MHHVPNVLGIDSFTILPVLAACQHE